MKVVVIGGHTRNIGKTSVMAGLIGGLEEFRWTAVKITQYGHAICSLDGQPCGCAPTEHAFLLTEEEDAAGRSDTSRFLQAGARRSLWLRVRQGQLAEALPAFYEALRGDEWVMVESNSILRYLTPRLYLVVLDSSRRDFKASAVDALDRADALVPIGSGFNPRAWPALRTQTLVNKPVFPAPAGKYLSPALLNFVRARLCAGEAELQPALPSLLGNQGAIPT